MDLVYFIVLVGVLIFVHESGHFMWAKLFGVRVLKFSLGFGPKIAGFQRGETEYVIAAVPLGGYVRMLGESPNEDVPESERARAFDAQALWKRFIIVLAGPLMNLGFPLIIYFAVFLGVDELPPAMVGAVLPGQPADGKLLPGDRVLAVEGESVETFYDLTRIVSGQAGRTLRFKVERGSELRELAITPVRTREEKPLDLSEDVGRIGITLHQPLAAVGVRDPASPAGVARVQTFDLILAAGGKPTPRFTDLDRVLSKNQGSMVPLSLLRPEPVRGDLGRLLGVSALAPRMATLTPNTGEGGGAQRSGLEPLGTYVSYVRPLGPEAKLGLLPGDRLVRLDGQPVRHWSGLLAELRAGRDRAHQLEWERGGRSYSAKYLLERETGTTEYGQSFDRYVVGMRHWEPVVAHPNIDNPHRIAYAAAEAWRATAEVVELTAVSIVRLVQGRLSMKTLGGPLTIFDAAGEAAREGALNYLVLMGFISINLGLINLMPIPMLDGGHILFLGFELVSRKPLSVRVREYASIAGLSVLIVLMVLAFKNDLERRFADPPANTSGE